MGSITDKVLADEAEKSEVAMEENPEDAPIAMRKSLEKQPI